MAEELADAMRKFVLFENELEGADLGCEDIEEFKNVNPTLLAESEEKRQ